MYFPIFSILQDFQTPLWHKNRDPDKRNCQNNPRKSPLQIQTSRQDFISDVLFTEANIMSKRQRRNV